MSTESNDMNDEADCNMIDEFKKVNKIKLFNCHKSSLENNRVRRNRMIINSLEFSKEDLDLFKNSNVSLLCIKLF